MTLAWRIARRELRGGLRGFRIFIACLALGVAAIAAVGMVRSAIQGGLEDQGAVLLGGDAQLEFTYRRADADERAWMDGIADKVSEIIDFRSMAVVGDDSALTQVKAVDSAYPLVGQVALDSGTLADALAVQGGIPGAAMDRILVDRLGLKQGDRFKLGLQEFRLGAVLIREPDSATGGFALGPRTIVASDALGQSGLIGPGSLFQVKYRLTLPKTADLEALSQQAETRFKDKGVDWDDSRRAAPGVERFVDRIGAFLVLVGLAGLAVGGVGIQAAVRAYLDAKVSTIATLKTLGADGALIFRIYLLQVGVLALVGVALGLGFGALAPWALGGVIAANLPFPVEVGIYPRPLFESAFYGLTAAFLFTLWPLARSQGVRAAALYRGAGQGGRVALRHWLALLALAGLLVGGAVLFSGAWKLALGAAAGVGGALLLLTLAAWGLRRGARAAARAVWTRGRVGLRLALAAIGGPQAEAGAVVLSLGLGLSVLAAVGQMDANLRSAISNDLPERAPAFFFVDIQPDQIGPFLDRMNGDAAVSRVESAPMLRGSVIKINGKPAADVAGEHWVVRGDRGITFAAAMPKGTKLVAGDWWPEDYTGPAQISFAKQEAEEIGLTLGDSLTVNVLGREIEAKITSLREVDFATGGMGFVILLNASALQGAPHTNIATVYADESAEAGILRDITKTMPNVTAIAVRDAISRVTEALGAIATATALAAGATLITGFVVLFGAAAAGERGRVYEAAVMKTLGATRGQILRSFALRFALIGGAAGAVALAAGAVAAWSVLRFVMEVPYHFEPLSAVAIVAGGVLATMIAGLAFALRPLAARPAQVLRAQE